MALGVQGEAPLIIQGQFSELATEGRQAGLAVLAQVELQQDGRDRRQGFAAGRACVGVGAKHLTMGLPRERAWMNSAKHHLEASQWVPWTISRTWEVSISQ